MTKRYLRQSGFSLIEIMIVIALVALITTIGIPSLNSAFRTSKESFARRMALLLRDARDRAMLRDKLLRLRVDLDKQEYWLEEAPSTYLRPKIIDPRLSEREKEEAQKKEADTFRLLKELTPDKVPVPSGLKITQVVSPRMKAPQKEGTTDIFFYSSGGTDGASIHFEDDDHVKQRITLHPITGHSKLEMGAGEEAR